MAWPAINQHFTQEHFRLYVSGLIWPSWRPSKIVWHNTAAPSLAQWKKSADQDKAKGKVPGISRILALNNWYKVHQGWPGSPHLFIADDYIWVMNPLNARGTHSPSFNTNAIGIEMVGDFSREDDDSGSGLKVKNNTILATALLCSELGIDPTSSIFLHKQDPRTTHDCPGKDIAQDKQQMIVAVIALMEGGEHNPDAIGEIISGEWPIPPTPRKGVTTVDGLNFRRGPGVTHESVGSLPSGVKVTILNEAANGSTGWFFVRTPGGYEGWVAARFVTEEK